MKKLNEKTNSRNDSERAETNKFTQYKHTQSRPKLMEESLKPKKNLKNTHTNHVIQAWNETKRNLNEREKNHSTDAMIQWNPTKRMQRRENKVDREIKNPKLAQEAQHTNAPRSPRARMQN